MAPRFQTLPPAQTASAREARRAFFCELCQKGYTRMNEYESHLSSYDHAHKQRMKDMKAMVRDPGVAERARRLEAKATDAVISIKLGGEVGQDGTAAANAPGGIKKGGFRKGGFKSAFSDVTAESQTAATTTSTSAGDASQMALPIIPMPAVSGTPSSASAPSASAAQLPPPQPLPEAGAAQTNTLLDESDTDDEDYQVYDPRQPTD